jgi:anthranilate phosphoribosyltransferase
VTIENWPALLGKVISGDSLTVAEAATTMRSVMNNELSEARLAGLLVALKSRGETVDEVVGFRDAILEAAEPIKISTDAVDIVGSGGDPIGVINVSSIASIVVAASGIPVIKHGNRAASSASGANDVLTELGINIGLDSERVAKVFAEIGLTYLNAMVFHPGFKNAANTRGQLGIPTIFNVLGPLCNPARPEANALGMAQAERIPLVVGLYQQRGATALVYRGEDGIDKLTTTGHSRVIEVSRGSVTEHDFDPREIGFTFSSLESIRGGSPAENASLAHRVLNGEPGAARDIILLNSAAGIIAHRLSHNPAEREISFVERMSDAVEVARAAIDSGAAKSKLEAWVAATS